MTQVCTGCGSTMTIAQIQAEGHVTCCPDRHMVPIKDLWRSEYEAKAKVEALRVALHTIVAECQAFPIKAGLAFRCESIALNALDDHHGAAHR